MTKLELADAMLKGLHTAGIIESVNNYINSMNGLWLFCKACALGCALIGKHEGDYLEAEKIYDDRYLKREQGEYSQGIFADLLGISYDLAIEIEHKHLNGMPIKQIAAWLKSSEGGERHA